MKQLMQNICVIVLLTGLVFSKSANQRILKSDLNLKKKRQVEPNYLNGRGATRDACEIIYPDNEDTYVTLIDSSANGYGMWATVTRPMDVNSNGDMLTVYRQYAGELTTHGQLGAGYGVVSDGEIEWSVQFNVNYNGNPPWGGGGVGGDNTAQARYPSGIASEEYPYAIWNEYTGNVSDWPAGCSNYGGRPYFSYDEFGWGGESWLYPVDLDPLYDCTKDLWQGSVGYGYDEASGQHHVSAVYDDWTRTGSYIFSSEAVEDGYIVLGTETLIVNPQHVVEDYTSSAILSMNNNGQGLVGVDGFFEGYDPETGTCVPPASGIICDFKTPMFKLTSNYGQSWAGDHGAFDFYYVPEEVFLNIMDTWPNTDVDACTGETNEITKVWSWYNFDMRVDNDGNPHIVVSLVPESDQYLHMIEDVTGFYHFTIDRDNIASPGPINSLTGWNWSYIPIPANHSLEWSAQDGDTYAWQMLAQLSISRENDDIIYVVSNAATRGDMDPADDCPANDPQCCADGDPECDQVEDNDCGIQDWPWELYPEYSEDIWVAKSSDNGSTWSARYNLTQTPKDGEASLNDINHEDSCSPEEMLPHSAHWSTDDRVYYQYQAPNWGFNEIGDANGADYMNRVFLGYSFVEELGLGGCMDSENCRYNPDAVWDNGDCTDPASNLDANGCDCSMPGCDADDAACGGLAQEDCLFVCEGTAGFICDGDGGQFCLADTEICTWNMAWNCAEDINNIGCETDCDEESEVNYWEDCDNNACGANHPAANGVGCGEGSTYYSNNCDGGRCHVCLVSGTNDDELSDLILSDVTDGMDCPSETTYQNNLCAQECETQSDDFWVATELDCDPEAINCWDVIRDAEDCADVNGFWLPFTDEFDSDTPDDIEEGGNPDECYCLAADSDAQCDASCPFMGDMNDDQGWNVLDIVVLANCVLAGNCGDLDNGCAGDLNDDGGWNVLDIVILANCVLDGTCGGRVDDASHAQLIITDNILSIEADGFIGGVEMTLAHGDNFTIDMTDQSLHADYLTTGNETRLLVINPETDELFSYSGDFEITEVIVANSYAEVPASLPLANRFSLSDAYPNPFNPTTTMTLSMPMSGDIQVEVYNLLGQVITTLASGYMEMGTYTLTWDASAVSSGVYFVKAQANGFTKTQKLMLVK